MNGKTMFLRILKYAFILLFIFVGILNAQYWGEVDSLKPVKPSVYFNGNRKEKKIALTLDDGWVEDQQLLDLLVEYKIKCTVFVPGKVVKKRPQWIKKLDSMGFEVCSHTYSHHWISRMSDKQLINELRATQKAIYSVTGKNYPYFRPPAGKYTKGNLKTIAREGYYLILWDNDLKGYNQSDSVDSQINYFRKFKKNGNIILGHFGKRLRTYQVLKVIIPEMIKEGYRFVTITELLDTYKVRSIGI